MTMRAQLIKTINTARSKLGWDDDLYRATLQRFGGVADDAGRVSLKTLNDLQMRELLKHMRASGFKADRTQRPHNTDNVRQLQKIEALLTDDRKPWAYAESMLRHMTKGRKDRLAFADERELEAIIVALDKAAIKRLKAALLPHLRAMSWDWYHAKCAAGMLFGFPPKWSFESSAQGMSELLRWFRGELAPFSEWPQS